MLQHVSLYGIYKNLHQTASTNVIIINLKQSARKTMYTGKNAQNLTGQNEKVGAGFIQGHHRIEIRARS